jgi:hypothetical protein
MNPQVQPRQLPPWHECYRAALLESDRNQLPVRINTAMDTLIQHLRGANDVDQRRERDRILQALRMLDLLQRVSADSPSNAGSSADLHDSHLAQPIPLSS